MIKQYKRWSLRVIVQFGTTCLLHRGISTKTFSIVPTYILQMSLRSPTTHLFDKVNSMSLSSVVLLYSAHDVDDKFYQNGRKKPAHTSHKYMLCMRQIRLRKEERDQQKSLVVTQNKWKMCKTWFTHKYFAYFAQHNLFPLFEEEHNYYIFLFTSTSLNSL